MKKKQKTLLTSFIVVAISATCVVFAPGVGERMTRQRTQDYFEGRLAQGIDDGYRIDLNKIDDVKESARSRNLHYLGDVERLTLPIRSAVYIRNGAVFCLVCFGFLGIVTLISVASDRSNSSNKGRQSNT